MTEIVKRSEYPFIDGCKDLPADREKDIKELRDWLQTQPHLPEISGDFLHLFLHSNYYSLEETKSTIENFYTLRFTSPELFSNRTLQNSKILDQLQIGQYGFLPKKTPEGYQVAVIGMTNQNISRFNHEEITKAMFTFFDVMISENGLCPGYIIVFDTKEYSFSHFLRISYGTARKTMKYIQDAFPVRVKHIIVINSVSFFDKIYALLRPFMKPALVNKVQVHGSNLTEFYKTVPKDCLYEDYGGPWGTLKSAHENYIKLLETKYSKWLEDESTYAVDMSLKQRPQRKSFFSFW